MSDVAPARSWRISRPDRAGSIRASVPRMPVPTTPRHLPACFPWVHDRGARQSTPDECSGAASLTLRVRSMSRASLNPPARKFRKVRVKIVRGYTVQLSEASVESASDQVADGDLASGSPASCRLFDEAAVTFRIRCDVDGIGDYNVRSASVRCSHC